MERERFSKEQRDKADELFRAIGMDPDIYMPYARAQVVRADAGHVRTPTETVNNAGEDGFGVRARGARSQAQ